jgi:hypothetical protein
VTINFSRRTLLHGVSDLVRVSVPDLYCTCQYRLSYSYDVSIPTHLHCSPSTVITASGVLLPTNLPIYAQVYHVTTSIEDDGQHQCSNPGRRPGILPEVFEVFLSPRRQMVEDFHILCSSSFRNRPTTRRYRTLATETASLKTSRIKSPVVVSTRQSLFRILVRLPAILTEIFRDFPLSLQSITWIVVCNTPRPLSSKSLASHHSQLSCLIALYALEIESLNNV